MRASRIIAAFLVVIVTVESIRVVAASDASVGTHLVSGPSGRESLADGQGYIVDPDVFRLQTQALIMMMGVSLKIPPLLPIAVGLQISLMIATQLFLFGHAYRYDSAIVRAWTTENLLAFDYQLRSMASLMPDYVQKLREDQATLEQRIARLSADAEREIFLKGLKGPEAASAMDATALERGFLEAVTRKLKYAEDNFKKLNDKCVALLGDPTKADGSEGAIGAMRRAWIGGDALLQLTPEQRKAWNIPNNQRGGMLTKSAINSQHALVAAFADYVNEATLFFDALATSEEVEVNLSRGKQRLPLIATASEHLRVTVTNASKNLVFFVKVVPKPVASPGGGGASSAPPCGLEMGQGRNLFQAREIRARRGWMPLFPKGEALRVGAKDLMDLGAPKAATGQTGPIGAGTQESEKLTGFDIQFPSSVWFPVEPGDQVLLRVATYGDQRKSVRWLNLRGEFHRPELEAVRRNFYYLGYEAVYGLFRPHLNLLYSVQEEYQWGDWSPATGSSVKLPAEFKPAQVTRKSIDEFYGDYYEAPPDRSAKVPSPIAINNHQLDVRGDRYAWTVPSSPEALRLLNELPLEVNVTGWADFMHQTMAETLSSKPKKEPREQGAGILRFQLSKW